MTGKNLTFKLVLDGDSKGLVSAAKQSESVTTKVFETIKAEADKLKVASVDAAKEIGNIIPDELNKNTKAAKDSLAALSSAAENAGETTKRAGFEIGEAIPGDAVQLAESLGNKFFTAAKEIEALGDKSTISAGELRAMSSAGEQGLNALNLALKASQAELVRLQSTDGTLKDIEIAKGRVFSIQDAINEASSAFNYYQGVAINAMKGVDNATQSAINKVQQFSSVDLTGVVGEAQTASRAIESMGDGAAISSKELERVGQLGTQAINSLQNELQQANLELKALSQSSDAVSLNKFNEATAKVNALEDALSLTKTAYTDFQTKASTAMGSVSSSTDKVSNSATQAGHAIYAALGKAPPTVINDAIANLSKKLEDFKANSKMPAEEVARVTRLTEQEIARLRGELDGVDTSASKANMGMSTLSRGIDVTKFAVTALTGAMAALGIGLGIRELAQAADSYTNLSARINIATSEGGNFKQAMAGVHQIALTTNSSLDATANLFAKINDTGKEMGMTQQQALDLTKTINQAIKIGGGSAQASEAAVQQFIQALQSGVLRGDEFNSIMEQAPGLTSAMAKGLGVTTSELRKMAENGELGAERVVKAIQSQASEVQKTYDKFPLTISNALQKISTQWQILIGEMDQANGSSATVANALSVIADNLGILKVFFDDVAAGVGWFQDQLSEIDPSTIESIRSTLSAVYDTIKTVISSLAGIAQTAWSAFSSTLDAIAPLFNVILNGKEEVSGLTTLFNVFKIALGVVADGATGLNIALKLLLASVQFIAGGIYSLNASVLDFLGFDDLAAQAQNASDALFRQAEKNGAEAKRLALESKSATREAIKDITQTEQEANQERMANAQQTLDQLKAQEEKHKTDYKAISDERVKAEQQLFDARKSGNQAAIDLAIKGIADLDAKEKAYQAESKKITDEKIKAAQDWVNAQLVAADGTQKAADAATQKTMQTTLAAQGLKLEFDSAGKAIVKAMDDGSAGVTNLNNKLVAGRKGAEALGLDLDVTLNRVSKGFDEKKKNLDDFVNSLELMGVKGKQAGDVTYEAWLKWLETAKSQAEIDFAKAKLKEFGDQGQISTSQVEQGLIAIKLQAQKLPDDIDPVTEAFKRLGIETKANLKLAAQQALMDYITIRDSGKATAEGVQQAYEKMARAVAASGDAGVIAAANAAGANQNLRVEIDATGKASVKSMDELTNANDRVRSSAERIGDGYRNAGQIAREEAQSASDAWQAAAAKSNKEFRDEMKRQGEALSSMYDYQSYSKADVLAALKSKGYSDQEAQKLAGDIWSKGLEADKDAYLKNMGKGGFGPLSTLIQQEFKNAASKGLTTQTGTNKINELLRQLNSNSLVSTGQSVKAPSVDINSLAPSISTPTANIPSTDASKNVNYNINFGGQTLSLSGTADQEPIINQLVNQLKAQAKST
ncbi:tape measure domain-containing protein [Acinetobacter sp. ANC 4218]|uniref:tape measure protein n=1 Tax=Acinetobacter sp. ANC 4218 TaxID=1977880 RepID=UPI000A356FDD|nr:tape measure protein [Acinetobacter sp. ANC 4218]OTG70083.1 tape measure domain-containing protein [Acinetobacter sp. ANC 4218]